MRTELSLSDEWETPKELFEYLRYKYRFFPILDVCATKENSKCHSYYMKEDNGLNKSWHKKNWCNPPHSEIDLCFKNLQCSSFSPETYSKHSSQNCFISCSCVISNLLY